MKTEVINETMKSLPPVGITVAAVVHEITLNTWVAIATLVYIVLQAGYLVWKWYKEVKASKGV